MNDALDGLRRKLDEFVKAHKDLQAVGLPEDVLISYIIVKSKLPKKTILKVLGCQDSFYQEFTNNLLLEALE